MKQVVVSIADECLYKRLEAEAAKQGRSLDEIIPSALDEWLCGRSGIPTDHTGREHELAALRALDEIRARQPVRVLADDLLNEIRDERS
jgi:hypothetical protein